MEKLLRENGEKMGLPKEFVTNEYMASISWGYAFENYCSVTPEMIYNGWTNNFKVCLLLIFMWLSLNESQAQIWHEIIPLKSKREDVVKVLKGEQQLPDGSSYFNLKEEIVMSNITKADVANKKKKSYNFYLIPLSK